MKDGRYALIKSSGYGKLSPAKSHLTKPPIAVIKSPVAAKQTHNGKPFGQFVHFIG